MSHSVGIRDYRAALTTPGVRGPVCAALLGRLPIAMVAFSILLYVHRVTGTYATAGVVSAGVLTGVAIGSVVQGRIIDRIGPTRLLLTTSGVFAVFIATIVAAIEQQAPAALLVMLAMATGISQPTIGATSRAMWMRLLPPGAKRDAGMTYEAVITEVYFIVGPAISGVLLTAPWPGTGVVVSAATMVVGSVWYALTSTMRRHRPDPSRIERPRLIGALTSAGLRTVALASLGMGLIIGFVEVAVPAAATAGGHPAVGGLLLGVWSVSSAVFGLVYGARPWPRRLGMRLPVLLAGFGVLVLPLLIPGGLVVLGIMLLITGTLITPQTAAHSEAIAVVAYRGLVTESFGWVITAATLGIGLGQGIGGQIIERAGIGHAYLSAGAVGLVIASLVFLRRNTLADGVRTSTLQPAT